MKSKKPKFTKDELAQAKELAETHEEEKAENDPAAHEAGFEEGSGE